MTVAEIVEALPAHVAHGEGGYRETRIDRVIAGDLMSDILVSVESDTLLVTSLATEQAVRSADIVGIPIILLVNDKLPLPAMRDLARECGITLLATPMPMFESCAALAALMGA